MTAAALLLLGHALAGTVHVPLPSADAPSSGGLTLDLAALQSSTQRALEGAGLSLGQADSADYVASGVLHRVDVLYTTPKAVEVTVEWRVTERQSGALAYSVTTRGYAADASLGLNELASAALDRAAASLARRPRLAEAVAKAHSGVAVDRTVHVRRCSPPTLKLPADMLNTFESVLVVRTSGAVGTGVSISPDGFVLTAAHVAPKGATITVTTHAGQTLPATVIRRDTSQDLALLHVDGLPASCLGLGQAPAEIGRELFIVGTPAGLDYSVSKGVISGVRSLGEERFLQTDASINPGNSGGPMLDPNGGVIAIVSWKIKAAGFEGLGFGVPADAVVDRLGASLGDQSDTSFAPAEDEAKIDSSLVDSADPSQFGDAVKDQQRRDTGASRRKSGIALAVTGAVIAGGTGFLAGRLGHASKLGWTTLQVTNTVGWAGLLGGGALVGISFLSADQQPGFGASFSGRF